MDGRGGGERAWTAGVGGAMDDSQGRRSPRDLAGGPAQWEGLCPQSGSQGDCPARGEPHGVVVESLGGRTSIKIQVKTNAGIANPMQDVINF